MCTRVLVFLSVSLLAISAHASSKTRQIAPGVHMPYINCGGVHSKPSNYSGWIEAGGRGLDTALMYGDDVQLMVGNAVEDSGLSRDELFITSKVPCCPAETSTGWCEWYSTEYPAPLDAFTRASIDIRLLGLKAVDLMLLHWPCGSHDETIEHYRRLEDLYLAGKARAIGISNFNASAIDALYASGLRVPPSVNQCGFSIGYHSSPADGSDYETIAKCAEKNITYSAYSPLGGLSHVDVLGNKEVQSIAQVHNRSTAQIALRWVIQQGIVAVTASSKQQYDVADLDLFDFHLSDSEMSRLRQI